MCSSDLWYLFSQRNVDVVIVAVKRRRIGRLVVDNEQLRHSVSVAQTVDTLKLAGLRAEFDFKFAQHPVLKRDAAVL